MVRQIFADPFLWCILVIPDLFQFFNILQITWSMEYILSENKNISFIDSLLQCPAVIRTEFLAEPDHPVQFPQMLFRGKRGGQLPFEFILGLAGHKMQGPALMLPVHRWVPLKHNIHKIK